MSPATEAITMRLPVQTMLAATTIATNGSRRFQPVTATATTPTSTPADVQTSVSRWWALACSVTERCARAARSSTSATPRFTSDATTETARPSPTCSSARGCSRRSTAATAMLIAATTISVPSTPAEKYSAFP